MFALTTMQATFMGIIIVLRELNLTFAIGYLAGVVLIAAANVLYVFPKKSRVRQKAEINKIDRTAFLRKKEY